jgi:amino acid transporter
MMPRAGGQYVYLREALGPLWGFLYGWSGKQPMIFLKALAKALAWILFAVSLRRAAGDIPSG